MLHLTARKTFTWENWKSHWKTRAVIMSATLAACLLNFTATFFSTTKALPTASLRVPQNPPQTPAAASRGGGSVWDLTLTTFSCSLFFLSPSLCIISEQPDVRLVAEGSAVWARLGSALLNLSF